jgi:hypothetical protein
MPWFFSWISCFTKIAMIDIYLTMLFTKISGNIHDWLIIYGFTSRSRIFHLYRDVTIAGEELQNLGLCSALRAFEQEGILIVPHLLDLGFPVSFEGPPHSVASYRHTRGYREFILTWVLTGKYSCNISIFCKVYKHWIC